MALVITKKVRTILLVVLGVLVVGGGGFLIWRVTQEDSLAPEDGEAAECPTDQGYTEFNNFSCVSNYGDYCCADNEWVKTMTGCYKPGPCKDGQGWVSYKAPAPTPPPSPTPEKCDVKTPTDFKQLEFLTTVASQKSELILYYQALSPYTKLAQFVFEGPDGQTHTINPAKTQDRIATGIVLESGERAKLITVKDSSSGGLSLGWYPVNQNTTNLNGVKLPDNTCGTGLMGPLTNNDCQPYDTPNVSTYMTWANNAGDDTVFSRQCWADSKEWVGDYDFNDFFVQLAYLPIAVELVAPSCGTLEDNYTAVTTDWPVGTFCSVGTSTPASPTFPSLGGETNWTCSNDGSTVNCLATRDDVNDPSCGTLEGNYTSDTTAWPEGTFCSVGTSDPASPTFPSSGEETTWTCNNDGNTVSCLATRDIEIQTNPDWTIDKSATSQYILINDETYGKADYSITVTNIGDGDGNIDRIVDDLDEKVLEEYIQEISNEGMYFSGSITWDLEGEDEVFSQNESLVLTYSLQIPQEAFGIYDNIATAYPTVGDNFSDYARITLVSEEEEQPTTVPQTGVFDTVLGKVLFGVILILLGISWPNIYQGVVKLNYSVKDQISDRRIKNFERRVAKDK